MLFDGKPEFRITQQEMIKGIDGHGYYDELVIPIIENTAWEHELADSLGEAIAKYPKAVAVLVRQHGMYVWGKTWEQAKRHGECLHYLFDVYINANKMGLSSLITKKTSAASPRYKHVLLDIEGTLSPISFVKDVLFPYSVQNVRSFLSQHWEATLQIRNDLVELSQKESSNGAPEVSANASVEDIASFVEWLVKMDRKVTPLKSLQGLIWQHGYASGQIVSQVFDDVPSGLSRLNSNGVKFSIYSSGSRQAQHLLFQYSNHGDLRKHLTAYFDTKIGMKVEANSYLEILSTLGVDNAKDVVFVTDLLAEAKAARMAGLDVLLSVRPGNGEIAEAHDFPVITSFDQL
jgi:methylthioribulose 1-phosphate dehydratase/enolase-phosphatase E1